MSESEREQNNQAKAAEKALEISEDLVIRLAENGIFSKDFTALLAAATVIACLGLFQNSPAVIIGAMIVAPLMRPLSALLQIMPGKIEMSFEMCFSELDSWLCSLKFSYQCFPKLAVGILAI
ncbi:MAG: hypothetical protein J0M35_14455 [Candidatus Obscuribacter phosphatis]|uniref:Uncharacterized protein n=1 Tax=Candidatus Obscuribacter phosphatis TaxID=1906157 RepID=A0A8J7PJI5_9BACT|nr:hypothetical protein [Candidatus Obscuribacter phosphatis]